MCLALPGKVVSKEEEKGIVDFGGVRRDVNLRMVPEVKIGEHVIVHAGFAIQILQKEAAEESLKVWEEVLKGGTRVEDVI